MFANTQMMGMDLGAPDVVNIPMPAPTPTPLVDIAMGPTAVPSQVQAMCMCMPFHNMATTTPLTNGDNAGVALGVASGTMMGPSRHLTASFTTLVKGAPLTRMTSVSLQNSTNVPGARIVPSQPKCIVLKP